MEASQPKPTQAARLLDSIFAFLASLRLAVVVLLGLVGSLATATFLESIYDTPTAQYYVYRSAWFEGLLGLLGVNIFFVAISRYPWKPKHIPFLLAHVGILLLLTGSWITQKYGLDGSLRVSEGEVSSTIETEQAAVVLSERETAVSFPIRWIPPGVDFQPITLHSEVVPYDLKVDRFISRADPIYDFVPSSATGTLLRAALQVRLVGGPMRITQDFWLWGGDPAFSSQQAGPARLALVSPTDLKKISVQDAHGKPLLVVARGEKPDGLFYKTISSDGKVIEGFLPDGKVEGTELEPGWKSVKLTLTRWLPSAALSTTYEPSKMQFGPQVPPSAIHLVVGKGGPGSEVWLGLGDRAALSLGGRTIDVGYYPQRLTLPFAVKLDRFHIDRYEGTMNPASYESRVTVMGEKGTEEPAPPSSITISMNEPLHYKGITLYQASYEDAKPRPVTSIFSVNRDPGRFTKYLGSILIVGGAIALFLLKYGFFKNLFNKKARAS